MRFSVGLRASLAVSIVALALLVSLLSIGVHAGLEVRTTIASAADRTRAWAQQVALLASRAANAGAAYMEVAIGPGLATPADAVRQDPALKSLFESALAGDPTIYDLGVFDTRGRALAHSDSSQVGKPRERRATLAVLESGSPLVQAMRLLGPPLTYDAVVPMRAGTRAFGEVRVGVSTALLREQLVDSLRVGLWVTAAALLLAILIALAFAQLLSQRVKTVAMGLERLREGEFGYRLAVEGRDELALLASSINALGERLEATRARAASGEADPDELLMATGQVTAWAKVASGLAHELADPLNAAALHLGHLKRKWKGAAPEATRHLSVLEDELKRLEQIVLGFRRFSMLGEMRAQWFDLRSLLDEVVERAREAGQDRRLEFRLEQDGTPERFWGDASLLRQALSNLIANAEQSMPGGGRVALAARRGSEGIEIRITDEGMGIPEEVQPRVFDLYFTTKEAGSGIGLAVVRQVVQLHGGRIHLRSAPGQGTEVTLQLPVRGHETGHAA